MHTIDSWRTALFAAALAIVIGFTSISIKGCSYNGFATSEPLSTSTNIDTDQSTLEEKQYLKNPGPLTIVSLQENLFSFESTTSLSSIGSYPLDTYDIGLLSPALNIIEEQGYNVGVVMMDLSTGYGVAYNADTEFYSASSVKGPYIVSLAAGSPESINNWSLSMRATIEYSDNDEYFLLRSIYGDDNLMYWCEDAGVDTSLCEEWYPWYSTRTLSKLWLRNYEYFSSGNEHVDEVASWFNIPVKSAIYDGLGSTYEVNTKGGWIDDEELVATIDAGIIYAENSPYIVIIMTDIPDNMPMLDPLVQALDDIHDNIWSRME